MEQNFLEKTNYMAFLYLLVDTCPLHIVREGLEITRNALKPGID